MSVTTTRPISLFGLEPSTYRPHAIHAGGWTYPETNCYTDVLVELLHARGDEPVAAMGFIVRSDFEGDQWTFFKPPPSDLELLFGVDIHEMQPLGLLPEQIAQQLVNKRTLIVELDAWHLPDTLATSYRREHVKTSVAPEAIDLAGERLRYFHNGGLHELGEEDYRGALRLDPRPAPGVLPPYIDLVRFDAGPRLAGEELRAAALPVLRHHLARRPADNPFTRFGQQLGADLPGLLQGTAESYHAYAFANVRMAGSAFEIAAAHVDWLLGRSGASCAGTLREIVDGCKVLSFRLARRRAFDPAPTLDVLALAWERGLGELDKLVS